eukprot:g3543.t1
MDCTPDSLNQMNICTRDEYRMEVDNPTFIAATDGFCVPACEVEMEGLRCHFNSRWFGDVYIPEDIEPPLEPPESDVDAPASAPDDEIIEYSIPEPSLEEEIYVPEPSLEEEIDVPEPSLEEEIYVPEPSFEEEIYVPEPSFEEELDDLEPAPSVSEELEDEFFTVQIAAQYEVERILENEVYVGEWTDCTQHCAQSRNGTRVRISHVLQLS